MTSSLLPQIIPGFSFVFFCVYFRSIRLLFSLFICCSLSLSVSPLESFNSIVCLSIFISRLFERIGAFVNIRLYFLLIIFLLLFFIWNKNNNNNNNLRVLAINANELCWNTKYSPIITERSEHMWSGKHIYKPNSNNRESSSSGSSKNNDNKWSEQQQQQQREMNNKKLIIIKFRMKWMKILNFSWNRFDLIFAHYLHRTYPRIGFSLCTKWFFSPLFHTSRQPFAFVVIVSVRGCCCEYLLFLSLLLCLYR